MLRRKFIKSIIPLFIMSCVASVHANDRPNILLIVADDLGYSDLQPFGGEIHTPNINKLTEKGMILKNFYSGPTCSVTRSMLMTGNDNHQAGVGTMVDFIQPEHKNSKNSVGYQGVLNNKVITVAEILKENGYYTIMSGKWHLGRGDNMPKARGFMKSFTLVPGGATHFDDGAITPMPVRNPVYYEDDVPYKLPEKFFSSDYFADKMVKYLKEKDEKKPFFAYLSFTAPHWPLQAHLEDIEKYNGYYKDGYEKIRQNRYNRMIELGLIDKSTKINNPIQSIFPDWEDLTEDQKKEQARIMQVYAAMIDNMDRNIGKVVDQLKASGELDNTLILFTSDNGAESVIPESFGIGPFPKGIKEWVDANHDNSLANLGLKKSYVTLGPQWAQVASTPLPFFKGVLSQGGIKVPTFIHYPKVVKNKKINDDVVHVMDFVPTVLDMLSIKKPDTRNGHELTPLEGTSFLPILKNKKIKERAIGWEFNNSKALIKGKWLLENQESPYGNSKWQLYDLKKDPTNLNDLAAKHPKVVNELVKEWNNYAERVGVVEAPIRYTYGKMICMYGKCTEPSKVEIK